MSLSVTVFFSDAFNMFLQGVLDSLKEAWLECLLGALSMHIYFMYAHPVYKPKAAHVTKAAGLPQRRSSTRGAVDAVTGKASPLKANKEVSTCKGYSGAFAEDAKDVQKILSKMAQKGDCDLETLGEYETIVRRRGANLRRQCPNMDEVRAAYVSLIKAAFRTAPAAADESPPASACGGDYALASAVARDRVTQLLADMRTFNIPRTADFLTAVLRILVRHRFKDAMWFHGVMCQDGVALDRAGCLLLLHAAIAAGDAREAIHIFGLDCKFGQPSVKAYMAILRIYDRSKNWKGAAEFLQKMKEYGVEPDTLALNTVLGLCVETKQVPTAEELFQSWRQLADTVSCNILLKGYAQGAHLTKAEGLLKTMRKGGPPPNIISFNTIMDCAVRSMQAMTNPNDNQRASKHHGPKQANAGSSTSLHMEAAKRETDNVARSVIVRRPWTLLDQMAELGLQPDRYTCSTLVKGMHIAGCSPEDVDRAVMLIQQVGPEKLKTPSAGGSGAVVNTNIRLLEVLFNTLLDACISIQDLERMAQIFEMMQEFNVAVSSVTFSTLIKAFAQAKQLEHCHEVWRKMEAAQVMPTVVTYGCYIDACIRNDAFDEAERLFNSMSKRGVQPNAVIYTSLIRGFAHACRPSKALELYSRMRAEGIEATTVTFNSVLDVIVRQLSDTSKLDEVIGHMHKDSIAPDAVTYSILIKASCEAGNVGNALILFRQIRNYGLVFDQVAFNTMLVACSKAERVADAEDIYREMCTLGMTPTHVTISIMVKMYGKMKMLDKALQISDQAEAKFGIEPNLFIYTCLIQACVRNQQVKLSWELFNRMLRRHVEPDAITYGTLINGCVYQCRFDAAMSLVRHARLLPPKAQQPDGDMPFEFACVKLTRPFVLQREVLSALLIALRRKERFDLAQELECIIAEQQT